MEHKTLFHYKLNTAIYKSHDTLIDMHCISVSFEKQKPRFLTSIKHQTTVPSFTICANSLSTKISILLFIQKILKKSVLIFHNFEHSTPHPPDQFVFFAASLQSRQAVFSLKQKAFSFPSVFSFLRFIFTIAFVSSETYLKSGKRQSCFIQHSHSYLWLICFLQSLLEIFFSGYPDFKYVSDMQS